MSWIRRKPIYGKCQIISSILKSKSRRCYHGILLNELWRSMEQRKESSNARDRIHDSAKCIPEDALNLAAKSRSRKWVHAAIHMYVSIKWSRVLTAREPYEMLRTCILRWSILSKKDWNSHRRKSKFTLGCDGLVFLKLKCLEVSSSHEHMMEKSNESRSLSRALSIPPRLSSVSANGNHTDVKENNRNTS